MTGWQIVAVLTATWLTAYASMAAVLWSVGVLVDRYRRRHGAPS